MKRTCAILMGIFLICAPFILSSCGGNNGGNNGAPPDSIGRVLGKGYDVTGRYAYSPEIKSPILDLDRLVQAGQVKRDPNLASGEFESVEGSTINEYQQSLAVKASVKTEGGLGKLGSFSAEIGSNFSSEKTGRTEYAFATSTSRIVKDAYFIENRNNPTALLDYVSDGFKADSLSMTPESLIAKYGTHVMLGGILGARLDYHMSAVKKSGSSSQTIGAYASAKAKASFLSANAGVETSTQVDEEYSSSFDITSVGTSTKVFGGKPEYAQAIQNANDYDAWINSIDGNEIWSDYYPDSLVPIYEFIGAYLGANGAEKQQAVKSYYDTYFASKVITATGGGEACIMNLQVVSSSSESVNVPQGYVRLSTDLNKGAGGYYIYLCYQKGLDSSTSPYPITDLIMIRGEGASAPSGYEKINVDLNKDAGGDFIYLCYKRDPAKQSQAIRDILIKVGQGAPDAGYSYVCWNGSNDPADVNRNAGGSYIYIQYTLQQP